MSTSPATLSTRGSGERAPAAALGLFPKLFLFLLGVAVIPLAAVYVRTEFEAVAILAEARQAQIETAAEGMARAIDIYLGTRERLVAGAAELPALQQAARSNTWRETAVERAIATVAGVSEAGDVVVVVDRQGAVVADPAGRAPGAVGTSTAVRTALGGTAAVELQRPGAGAEAVPAVYVAAPIREPTGDAVLGAVVLVVGPERLWSLLRDVHGGHGGYGMLVDDGGLIIGHSTDTASVFTQFPHTTTPVTGDGALAFEPLRFSAQVADLLDGGRIDPVTRALNGGTWTLVVGMSEWEAFAPARRIGEAVRYTAGLGLVLAGIVAAIAARSISSPIQRMRAVLARAAQGDLQERVGGRGRDELGQLSAQVDGTLDVLAALVGEAGRAATAASSTSVHVAAATQHQALAMAEITATIDKLTHSAEEVATSAQVTSDAAEKARSNVVEGVASLDRIRERSDLLVERLSSLSALSERVGEIASVIEDITNKTHLLSVNAAIEAASAGEFGRRFGVVAQQVKQLADETREAAVEVKHLIQQTRAATTAAVTASEGVSLEVRHGVQVANSTDVVIDQMVQQVRTITRATQQQLSANRQVANTVAETSDEVQQVVELMGELEQRVLTLRHRLSELGAAESDLASVPIDAENGVVERRHPALAPSSVTPS